MTASRSCAVIVGSRILDPRSWILDLHLFYLLPSRAAGGQVWSYPGSSLPSEVRLPLLQEGRHTLAVVGAAPGDLLQVCLVFERLIQGGVKPVVDGALRKSVAARRAGGQLLGQCGSVWHEVIVRDHSVDQPEPQRLRRVHRFRGVCDLKCLPQPHQTREKIRAAESGTSPTRAKTSMKLARSEAIRMSAASARLHPAPAATPLTAAMTGFSIVRI